MNRNIELWFHVEYQWPNNITKNLFLLPRIDDTLDMLVMAKWFLTPDLKSGYLQVGLYHGDKEKTSLSTR